MPFNVNYLTRGYYSRKYGNSPYSLDIVNLIIMWLESSLSIHHKRARVEDCLQLSSMSKGHYSLLQWLQLPSNAIIPLNDIHRSYLKAKYMYTKADVAISATSGLYKLNFGKSRLDLSLVTVWFHYYWLEITSLALKIAMYTLNMTKVCSQLTQFIILLYFALQWTHKHIPTHNQIRCPLNMNILYSITLFYLFCL